MQGSNFYAVLTGCILSLFATQTIACGESLFRVGKGVDFRQYTAPLPGSIVVVARTAEELMLVERLVAAGHDIHVVSQPADIATVLENNKVDIVLAYFSQRDEVRAQTAAASVDYLPVALDGTAEVGEARQMFKRSLTNDDSLKTFLKTIHRTLKARS